MSDMELSSLALRFLTEAEQKRIHMRKPDQVCEWEGAGFVFFYLRQGVLTTHDGVKGEFWAPVILRTSAEGLVHGGWVYLTPLHAAKEWREIQAVAPAYRRR